MDGLQFIIVDNQKLWGIKSKTGINHNLVQYSEATLVKQHRFSSLISQECLFVVARLFVYGFITEPPSPNLPYPMMLCHLSLQCLLSTSTCLRLQENKFYDWSFTWVLRGEQDSALHHHIILHQIIQCTAIDNFLIKK